MGDGGEGRLQVLTGVLHGEVGLALHGGGQLVHAQRELALKGRGLLAEGGEAAERALPSQSLHGGVAAGDGMGVAVLGAQRTPRQRRRGGRGRGRRGTANLIGWGCCR